MEVCESSCCGNAPRRTVSDLFDRGYRRNRLAPLSIKGAPLRDASALCASFSLDVGNGAIVDIRFQASTCITLIAYSELICELTRGNSVREAAWLCERELVASLPDVPFLKRDRARLAIDAFRAALAAASVSLTGEAA